MSSELIPITFHKILQSQSYTILILGTEEKRFAIYAEPHVGDTIQAQLTSPKPTRPFTHNLILSIFQGFEIRPLQIVLTDLEETTYFSRLYLEQKQGTQTRIVDIDTRPSDCITLALLHHIPLFCRPQLLDKVIPIED